MNSTKLAAYLEDKVLEYVRSLGKNPEDFYSYGNEKTCPQIRFSNLAKWIRAFPYEGEWFTDAFDASRSKMSDEEQRDLAMKRLLKAIHFESKDTSKIEGS